jgi:DNA-binding NarL/FixJ family response regulator
MTGITSGTEAITIVLVDDHPVVRDGLIAMLSVEPDFKIVGEASNGKEAMELIPRLRPSVVVLDLLLPDMVGSEIIRRRCERSSDINFLVLTTVAGDEEIYRTLEAGARGYLFKDMARKELIQAIRAVHQGNRYVPAPVGSTIAENLPRTDLSSREIQVLELVAAGMRNKEIAYRIKISEATVNAHIKHVLQKLNAADRTHAVTKALKRGIIRL